MNEPVFYKEQITATISTLSNNKKEASWPEIVNHLKLFILDQYDGRSLKDERANWKRRIKAVAKDMGVKIVKLTQDAWKDIEVALSEYKQTTSTSNHNSSNYKLTNAEKNQVLANYTSIEEKDQWILSTGTVVEQKMKELAESCTFEHPVHSMIIDPDDTIWQDFFTMEELGEIKAFNVKPLNPIPEELQTYLNIYDEEWETGLDLYQFADNQKHHPIKEFEKKWIRESMVAVSELFMYQKELVLNDCSESDFLHQLWPFLYKQFKDCSMKAMLGERCSVAVAVAKNGERRLETKGRRKRKVMGARLDILFKKGVDEVGSCEVGKDCVITVDDKYMDDGLVKLPKTLRDMLSALVEKNPAKINQISTIGFLMMGLEMEVIRMDIPKGTSISRIVKTDRFSFPSCIKHVSDFINLLELAWKGKQAMLEAYEIANSRKRKATELSVNIKKSTLLPQSFYHS